MSYAIFTVSVLSALLALDAGAKAEKRVTKYSMAAVFSINVAIAVYIAFKR